MGGVDEDIVRAVEMGAGAVGRVGGGEGDVPLGDAEIGSAEGEAALSRDALKGGHAAAGEPGGQFGGIGLEQWRDAGPGGLKSDGEFIHVSPLLSARSGRCPPIEARVVYGIC